MDKQAFSYIDSDHGLRQLCEQLQSRSSIALDTEFVRENTYYPIPALIQLYCGEQVYLLDPLAIKNFDPLIAILNDTSIVKVMHSCSEDMDVFNYLFNTVPSPVFDTQVAAGICGIGFSMGYQRLVEALIGHSLAKTETRSDWLQRPLSDEQCQYALHDVLWLLDIYHDLTRKLEQLQRGDWCQQDCVQIVERALIPQDDDSYYLRVKSAWRLEGPHLNVLKALCAWRERTARSVDIPRGRLATDGILMEAAQLLPSGKAQLRAIPRIRQSTLRKYADEILSIIDQAASIEPIQYPPALLQKNSRDYRQLLKDMQRVVLDIAGQHNLPIEILGRKRDLEEYIELRQQSLIGQSWRAELITEALEQLLNDSQYTLPDTVSAQY